MPSIAVLAAAATFNLVCTGANTTGKMLDLNQKATQVQTVLRVDLDSKRWCSGDCEKTAEISEVNETSIVFYREDDQYFDKFLLVNREDGKFMQRYRNWLFDHVEVTQGICEKADFTGFPRRKF